MWKTNSGLVSNLMGPHDGTWKHRQSRILRVWQGTHSLNLIPQAWLHTGCSHLRNILSSLSGKFPLLLQVSLQGSPPPAPQALCSTVTSNCLRNCQVLGTRGFSLRAPGWLSSGSMGGTLVLRVVMWRLHKFFSFLREDLILLIDLNPENLACA